MNPVPAPAGFHVLADHVTIRGFEIAYGEDCAPGIEFEGSHNTFAENSISISMRHALESMPSCAGMVMEARTTTPLGGDFGTYISL